MQGTRVNQTPKFVETDTASSFLFLHMITISNATLSIMVTELSQLLCTQRPVSPLVYPDDGPFAQIRRDTLKNEVVHLSFYPSRQEGIIDQQPHTRHIALNKWKMEKWLG